MSHTDYPRFDEITLESLINNVKKDFNINKGAFENDVFGYPKRANRLIHHDGEWYDYEYQRLFDKIKELSKNDSALFVATMHRWYPRLSRYRNEKDIISIITESLNQRKNESAKSGTNINNIKQFIENCLEYDAPIKSVKIAAHTGWRWFDDHERTNLLISFAQQNIDIKIICNSQTPTIEIITNSMSDPTKDLRYMGINSTLSKWHEYERKYPCIQLNITNYPLLHQTLIVEFKDNSQRAFIRDYVYGSPFEHASPHRQISFFDPEIDYFISEFDFLWNTGQSYDHWYNSLPSPEETITPNDYILICPSYNQIDHDNGCCIYSLLSISEGNKASLQVNIEEVFKTNLPNDSNKYPTYKGNLKITQNTIFISLYNDDYQEEISISFVNSPRHKDRFIGIMTSLTPSGQQPIAFKCVCFERTSLNKINYQAIDNILNSVVTTDHENMLAFDNRDINFFYSDNIFQAD